MYKCIQLELEGNEIPSYGMLTELSKVLILFTQNL